MSKIARYTCNPLQAYNCTVVGARVTRSPVLKVVALVFILGPGGQGQQVSLGAPLNRRVLGQLQQAAEAKL